MQKTQRIGFDVHLEYRRTQTVAIHELQGNKVAVLSNTNLTPAIELATWIGLELNMCALHYITPALVVCRPKDTSHVTDSDQDAKMSQIVGMFESRSFADSSYIKLSLKLDASHPWWKSVRRRSPCLCSSDSRIVRAASSISFMCCSSKSREVCSSKISISSGSSDFVGSKGRQQYEEFWGGEGCGLYKSGRAS